MLGDNIRLLRSVRGISQVELGEGAGSAHR